MDHCVKRQQELFWSLLTVDFLFGLFDVQRNNQTNTAREASQKLTRKQMSLKINQSPLINMTANDQVRSDRKDKFMETVAKIAPAATKAGCDQKVATPPGQQ